VKSFSKTTAYGKNQLEDGTYIYTANRYDNTISQVNLSTGSVVQNWVTLSGSSYHLAINNNYIYVVSYNTGNIFQVNLSNQNVVTWSSPGGGPTGISIYGNYVYVSNYDLNKIIQINLYNGNITNSNFVASVTQSYGMTIINNYLYVFVSGNAPQSIGKITLQYYFPPTCFKEDTKILTDKGYIPIQHLRKGNLIKTVKHGLLPINMIGKKEIYHPSVQDRIKEQLYKCTNDKYPEIFEDLIITGCHSILVDNFVSPEQKQLTSDIFKGEIYVTDDKYRLLACVDDRSSVYENPGNYTIYHLALENDNYYMNYGIYANGLLVETCSKRYLKELSYMDLIE
jgi:hypothetical protein